MVLTLIDITSIKRAEARFRVAVEAAPNAMLMVNHHANYTRQFADRTIFRLVRATNCSGRPLECLLSPESRNPSHATRRTVGTVRPLLAGRGSCDLYGLRQRRQSLPLEMGLRPVEMDQETFAMLSLVDISKRKDSVEAACEKVKNDSNE